MPLFDDKAAITGDYRDAFALTSTNMVEGHMVLVWALYILWLISIAGTFWLIYVKREIPFVLAYVPLISVISVLIFSYVFIFNRGSNVAQFSQSHDLWWIWSNLCFPLSTLAFIALISSVIFKLLVNYDH